jgi:hypothetical protein
LKRVDLGVSFVFVFFVCGVYAVVTYGFSLLMCLVGLGIWFLLLLSSGRSPMSTDESGKATCRMSVLSKADASRSHSTATHGDG